MAKPKKVTQTQAKTIKNEAKHKLKEKARNVKKLVAKSSKKTPSLKPPAPNPTNQFDNQPRLHVAVSNSGYGIAYATSGPPSGKKAYFRPAEQKVSDPHDQTINKLLTVYGTVKLRNRRDWSSNDAMQMEWKTRDGTTKTYDWRVSF